MFGVRNAFLRLRSFVPLINVPNIIKPQLITPPLQVNVRNYSSTLWNVQSTRSSILQNVTWPTLSNSQVPTRSVTKFSIRKGKRKSVRVVPVKFFRLGWGAWIRTIAGRHRHLWRKNAKKRLRYKRHFLCNATQSRLLDKMVGSYWRKRRYYLDDPYEPYHTREEFYVTARKPKPFIPHEDRLE